MYIRLDVCAYHILYVYIVMYVGCYIMVRITCNRTTCKVKKML